jgi:hypothetical protein
MPAGPWLRSLAKELGPSLRRALAATTTTQTCGRCASRCASRARQVAVERLRGLAADGQRPRPAALAEHPDDPLVHVDIVEGHADALGAAPAAVDQQQDDGGVAATGEVAPLAGREQPSQVLGPDHVDRLLGELGWLHAVHGAGRQVALGDRPLEEGAQAPVAVVGGGRLPAGELVGDELLDVVAAARAGEQRPAVGLGQ